jgi:hypothetical protein
MLLSMHLQVCEGERKGGNTRACSPRLASPGGAGRDMAWRGEARQGEAMCVGARRAREYSTKIRPKVSQAHSLILPFIFATSPCLIRFNRDRPSRLRDAVTLGGSSLYIRAAATKIATYQQPRKQQHI